MNRTTIRHVIVLPLVVAMAAVIGSHVLGYNNSGKKWGASRVSFYVNPVSVWVSESAAISALQQAAAVWSNQSDANIELVYAGRTSGTSLTLNNKNEVFFRKGTNGSYAAETYYWWDSNGRLIDADIVFWEGGYHFYTGSGCDRGAYIESVGAHEFGHFLGLGHSSVRTATMYPTTSVYCDRSWLTLDADDIAGIERIYPPVDGAQPPAAPSTLYVAQNGASPTSSLILSWADNSANELGFRVERSADGSTWVQRVQLGANVRSYTDSGLAAGGTYHYRVYAFNGDGSSAYSNTATGVTASAAIVNAAPTVKIASPGNNATFSQGAIITFNGSASDAEDGTLSSNVAWTSTIDGSLGKGASLSKALSAGTHTIKATVSDSGGKSASAQITIVVSGVTSTSPTLSARGYKDRGFQKAELTWKGIAAVSVTVFRNGIALRTINNSGTWTDAINAKGSGSYRYTVCAWGTSTCSNQATVAFN